MLGKNGQSVTSEVNIKMESWNFFLSLSFFFHLIFLPLPFFYLNGPIPVSFCLFSSFPHDSIQIQWDKSGDGVLGTKTLSSRMEGADESTELWRQPSSCFLNLLSLYLCLTLSQYLSHPHFNLLSLWHSFFFKGLQLF